MQLGNEHMFDGVSSVRSQYIAQCKRKEQVSKRSQVLVVRRALDILDVGFLGLLNSAVS